MGWLLSLLRKINPLWIIVVLLFLILFQLWRVSDQLKRQYSVTDLRMAGFQMTLNEIKKNLDDGFYEVRKTLERGF